MSEFHVFGQKVHERFRAMSEGELYAAQADDLFDLYLGSFPPGTNPIFRVRSEHDCSCCKHFIRNIGHLVSLKDGHISTVFDVDGLPYPFDVVAKALADHVRSLQIVSVFRTKERRYGAAETPEMRDGATAPIIWSHFHCDIVGRHLSNRPDAARGEINTAVGVFRRGLEELTADALRTVLELIEQNAIYRGAEFKRAVQGFKALHDVYPRGGSPADKNIFVWTNAGNPAGLFRNTAIGSLVVDLSAGEDIERAVRSFESKVAPQNYKRTTSLITPRMIDDAVAKLKDLGLESAIERRYARLPDVSVNNVLFVDNSVRGAMKDGIAGLLMQEVKPAKVDVKGAEAISIDDFLARVVPQASSIDLLVENRHLPNFMSVTAPAHSDAGPLFKWDNAFAWSYDGDVTDSIKEKVKRAGGKIDAYLRVSLAWYNFDDLDLHIREPGGKHVFFGNKDGKLDVDMNAGSGTTREPVENIVYDRSALRDGVYRVIVHQYRRRETLGPGFMLELEYGGKLHHFSHQRAVSDNDQVQCLQLTVARGELVKVEVGPSLTGTTLSQDKWGVKTETLVPVDTLMASPNHWDGQEIGNKHWFFILKGCRNPEPARGIYNEFLKSALDPHRKVFEVLGAKTKCRVSDEQLSGVGYSSTRKDQAIVVVKGDRLNKAFQINF